MILGAQMYTLRVFFQNERDLDFSLGRVADMGYRTVQISGIGPIPPERVHALCVAHGLEIVLTHTDPERILKDTERVIREHDIMECQYIGIGGMPQRYRMPEWFERFFVDFEKPAKQLRQVGKLLMYHNHAFELENLAIKRCSRA